MFGLANTCKVLRGYPPAVKEQVACASTEPGDSPVPSRSGESSELGEVFDQANLLQKKDSWNFEVARGDLMSKTPAQNKRGKGGRFVSGGEPAPEDQGADGLSEENVWSRGEGFGSIGPTGFGTPGQQASLGDLQALQAGVQAEQAKARESAEATGVRVVQLSEDVLGITSQIATLTTAVTALAATAAAAHKAATEAAAAREAEAEAAPEPSPEVGSPAATHAATARVVGGGGGDRGSGGGAAPIPAGLVGALALQSDAEVAQDLVEALKLVQEIENERSLRVGQPPRDVASLWKRDPGSGSVGLEVSELPAGSAYDLPYLEEPFPRPGYANPREGPPRSFFLPDQQELRVAAYLPEYSALHTEPAREEFDLLYFSTARACDVFRSVATNGLTRAAFEELENLHALQVTRLRCLLAKCKARQGTGWKSAEQVQRDWDEARFDVTFMPYLSDDERAERKKFHRDLRAAETHQLAKVTASQRVADRLSSQKRRNAEAAKRKAAQGGGA